MTDNLDHFTHSLVWSGREWWVTTRKNDSPWSGMPLDHFISYAESDYRPETKTKE